MLTRVLFTIFLFFSFFFSTLCVSDIGVAPSDIHLLQSNEFTCIRSGERIPISSVNDDFCDCQDGSDEPGTSACSAILPFTPDHSNGFYCKNRGFRPMKIPTSMVNDGVCDCCDGTDEYQSNKCQNTCSEAGADYVRSIKKEIFLHERGFTIRQEMIKEAQQRIPDLQSTIDNLQKEYDQANEELQHVEAEFERLKSLKDLAGDLVGEIGSEYEDNIREDEELEDDKLATLQRNSDPEYQQRVAEFESQHGISPKEVHNQFDEVERKLKKLRKNTEEKQTEIDKQRSLLETDFGPDSVYFALYGQAFDISKGTYRYSLKPFESIHQDSTLVGAWAGWEDGFTKMKYDHGRKCWGHGDRSALITLECGVETSLIDVDEPNPCFYTLTLVTPAACSLDYANSLRANIDSELDEVQDPTENKKGWFH